MHVLLVEAIMTVHHEEEFVVVVFELLVFGSVVGLEE